MTATNICSNFEVSGVIPPYGGTPKFGSVDVDEV